ncbi:MAG: DMT family transporter [Anaerolineales bacterium]|nr:DMT family transporter [Anaerolineales bacterium]MCB8958949.1 DMT family transporter [Ardenticatenales bacterium]
MPPDLLAIFYGLASGLTWGTGDFCGGLAAKKINSFVVVLIAHLFGTIILTILALLLREPWPGTRDLAIGAAAGVVGNLGLVAFYRALARNRMGLVASVTAAISAVVPVVVGAFLEGLPAPTQLLGFVLAVTAVVIISAAGGVGGLRLSDLPLPVLAGFGFASFFILIDQANSISVYWPLVSARTASVALITVVILFSGSWQRPGRAELPVILLAGFFDTAGNTLFTLAAAVGRLDIAAILSSLYPAATVLLAWFLLKERLTGQQWVGVVLALAALVLIAV